ncbi:MAG: metallophosphoesterase family protein [Candidatus Methylacidiphilales bacterium]
MLKRRELIQGICAAAMLTLPGCGSSRSTSDRSFRLLFLTDFHTMEERGAPEALALLARKIHELKPDLLIGGGDFIHGGFAGDASTSRQRFTLFRKWVDSLKVPAEWMIGNHDFVEAVDQEGNIRPGDPTSMYRQFMGIDAAAALYRSFDFGGYHFIVLQSVQVVGGKQPYGFYRGFIDEAQMSWLKEDLAAQPADQPLVLCTHIPLRTTFMQARYDSTAALPPNLVVENANEVLTLFEGRPLHTVLQGHLHVNETITWNQTSFVMAGAVCGAWWKGPNLGTHEGFAEISAVGGKPPTSRYMSYGWQAQAPSQAGPQY